MFADLDRTELLLSVGSAIVAFIGSIIAVDFAVDPVKDHFDKTLKNQKPPMGFSPEEIRNAAAFAVARFQIWVLIITTPIVVGVSAWNERRAWPLLPGAAIFFVTILFLYVAHKAKGPNGWTSWDSGFPAHKFSHPAIAVRRTDWWTGIVIGLNTWVALAVQSPG